MVVRLLHRLAELRARRLVSRVIAHLPQGGRVLDLGSGTGHNARALGESRGLRVVEADVSDLHAVGPGPVLFDGRRLPFAAGAFDATLAVFILHYSEAPEMLLREAARATAGPVILLQSTYDGVLALMHLQAREALTGRWAEAAARLARFAPRGGVTLIPRRYWTRPGLQRVFEQAGLETVRWEPEAPGRLSRDLYVLAPSPGP